MPRYINLDDFKLETLHKILKKMLESMAENLKAEGKKIPPYNLRIETEDNQQHLKLDFDGMGYIHAHELTQDEIEDNPHGYNFYASIYDIEETYRGGGFETRNLTSYTYDLFNLNANILNIPHYKTPCQRMIEQLNHEL